MAEKNAQIEAAYPPTAPVRVERASSRAEHAPDAQADALLLQFLTGRDAACPRCGYNVRDLTKPVCPECHERLVLRVGVQQLRIGKLIAAIIPGVFSGICGVILMVPIVVSMFAGSVTGPPWGVFLLDGFGLTSGVVACVIIAKRRRFIMLSDQIQLGIVAGLWFIHIAAFVILLTGVLF